MTAPMSDDEKYIARLFLIIGVVLGFGLGFCVGMIVLILHT